MKSKRQTLNQNSAERNKARKRIQLSEAGFLTDEDIKRIRKKLGLTQKEMAEKLGVGLKNFARYENLSVRQSKAMDNLLRILDKYPGAIEALKGK
jgi:HTH-type transcriptional regulator/antitoxin MqsA